MDDSHAGLVVQDEDLEGFSKFTIPINESQSRNREPDERGLGNVMVETPFTIVGNDQFFRLLYDYHQGSGFICILLSQIFYVLSVLFTLIFSTFLLTCVDWDSMQKGEKDNLSDALYPRCSPPEGRSAWITFSIFVYSVWWLVITIRTILYVLRIWKIRKIWTGVLGLSSDINWVTWQMVIDKYHDRIDNGADSHYIVNRIMRWNNYLIAMLTKDVFKLEKLGGNLYTEVMEWGIHKCLKTALFRDDDILIKDIIFGNPSQKREYVEKLRKTFVRGGILGLIFAPLVCAAYTAYFIYRYASEYYKNPKAMGLYSFTPIATWKLRDFNELSHVYTIRLNNAHPKIIEYLAQFFNPVINVIFRFIQFILGATFIILAVLSFFNQNIIISLLKTENSVFFYFTVIGALLVAVQNGTVEEPLVYEPEEKFEELVKILHCTPSSWATMSTKERQSEIRKFFRYKWMVYLQEIASVVYVPLLMIFWFPKFSADIVNFFKENSVHVDKLGIICSNAVFDMNSNMLHASDLDDNEIDRKMLDSLENFKQTYTTWDPTKFRRRIITQKNFDGTTRSKRERRDLDDNVLFSERPIFSDSGERLSGVIIQDDRENGIESQENETFESAREHLVEEDENENENVEFENNNGNENVQEHLLPFQITLNETF